MQKLFQSFRLKTLLSLILASILSLSSLYLVLLKTVPAFKQSVDNYAISKLTAEYGAALLTPEQEAKIVSIAREMGIFEHIVIRKMNTLALQKFGYYNAFACWAMLGGVIPFSNQPFMYFSEGFLEDLSHEEQRFLIGHELIHVRERHVMFFNLLKIIFVLLLLILFYYGQSYVKSRFGIGKVGQKIIVIIGIYLSFAVPNLVGLAYRRYIEKIADCESFKILNTHTGCLKMLERWQSDFKISKHDAYFGLLSDHPSCYDREIYCLEHQKGIEVVK